MEPEQNNYHCDIFIHILFATLKKGRSNRAIKTNTKLQNLNGKLFISAKGILTQNIRTEY